MFDMLGGITMLKGLEQVLSVHAALLQTRRASESSRGSCMDEVTLTPCRRAQVDRPATEKAVPWGPITTSRAILFIYL